MDTVVAIMHVVPRAAAAWDKKRNIWLGEFSPKVMTKLALMETLAKGELSAYGDARNR
jgi:hypothetical protein